MMMNKEIKKQKWCFILGREPLLSMAEIVAFFTTNKNDYKILNKAPSKYLTIEINKEINPEEIIKNIGGTIKICKKINEGTTTTNSIINFLLKKPKEDKIIFSITGEDKHFGLKIKKILKEKNQKVRYVEPKNTATIVHNKLIEKGGDFEIINKEIFATEAVQPFEEYGTRDYGRPRRDDLSGMLPPKLAMMMINLSGADKNNILLDPFCGSGTIITEAMLLGYKNLIGTDISAKAIADTEKNIEWIKQIKNKESELSNSNIKIYQTEILKINEKIENSSIDTIITEPFLGKPLKGNETLDEINKQTKELKRLYISAFKEFKKILKIKGVVIFIIPSYKIKGTKIRIDCIEEIKKLGFKPTSLLPEHIFLTYQRPHQHIGREIWKFTLENNI